MSINLGGQGITSAQIIAALGFTPASAGAVVMDGSAALGMFFGNDTDTGFNRVAANDLGVKAGGVLIADFNATGFHVALAGSAGAPSISLVQTTSGIWQPAAHSLVLKNAYQGSEAAENYGVKVTQRNSISIGTDTGTNDCRLDFQPALEICISNPAIGGSGVPMSIAEWSVGTTPEPVIFKRFFNETIGGSGAVPAGTTIMTLQGNADDGLGTAGVAMYNIYGVVTPGTTITPSAGNTRTYPGTVIIATAPGDGTTPITSRFQVRNTGDVDVISGNLLMGLVNKVITKEMRGRFTSMQPPVRAAIADDTIYTLPIPAESGTAIVTANATSLGSTSPWYSACVRVDATATCEKAWVNSTADAASAVVFTTAAVVPTDFSLYTDGKLTVVACSDHNVAVVNRLGAARTYSYFIYLNSQTNPA